MTFNISVNKLGSRLKIVVWVCIFAAYCSLANAQERPIRLGDGPHFLIDDYLVSEYDGLVRKVHVPKKVPSPVINKAESWHQQPLWFMKIIQEPSSRLYRMWYNIKNPGVSPTVCYGLAESTDGIKWDRPNLELIEVAGSKQNNMIAAPTGCFGLFLVDEGPDCSIPSRRYKMGYYNGGLCIAFSSDGLTFKEYEGNPVIHHSKDGAPAGQPGYINVISDVIDGCWDPLQNRYLIGAKLWDTGYPGKPKHAAKGMRRTVAVSWSKDFINWEKPEQIIEPDLKNGQEEFYGMQPMVRGNTYIGFLRVLRDDMPADKDGAVNGIGWTELITSRDGKHWNRKQEVFLDRNHKAGAWDHAMAWVGECITVGNEDYIYYGGYSGGHKVGDRQLGLAILRKNGFVSFEAGYKEGRLRTPLILLSCGKITVNAKVEGVLRARLLDASKKPYKGFDTEDCRPIHGDSLDHEVCWAKDISILTGKPVQIEFMMQNAQLFTFNFNK